MKSTTRAALYAYASNERARLESIASAAGDRLKSLSGGGAMGLTPDSVKIGAEYRAARLEYEKAAARLRAFNAYLLKEYRAEYRAERLAARG
jgi:hypothetical protein